MIAAMPPEAVLHVLGVEIGAEEPGIDVVFECCKRIRKLCRTAEDRSLCIKLGASRTIVAAANLALPSPNVSLEALAATLNVAVHTPQTQLVDAGAFLTATQAIYAHPADVEVCEMACLVVQNLCHPSAVDALQCRERGAKDGAIEAVLTVLKKHPDIKDVCIMALRLCVDKMPELRERAQKAGAPPEGLVPLTKESGGILSFRSGFGTSRRKAKCEQAASPPASPPSPPKPSRFYPVEDEEVEA